MPPRQCYAGWKPPASLSLYLIGLLSRWPQRPSRPITPANHRRYRRRSNSSRYSSNLLTRASPKRPATPSSTTSISIASSSSSARPTQTESDLRVRIDAMHNPASQNYHHWLTPNRLAARYGIRQQRSRHRRPPPAQPHHQSDLQKPGMVIDVSALRRRASPRRVRRRGHNHARPAAAAASPVCATHNSCRAFTTYRRVAALRDSSRPRHRPAKPIASASRPAKKWASSTEVIIQNDAFGVFPCDFSRRTASPAAMKLRQQAVAIALIEDTNLANPRTGPLSRNFAFRCLQVPAASRVC